MELLYANSGLAHVDLVLLTIQTAVMLWETLWGNFNLYANQESASSIPSPARIVSRSGRRS